MQLSKSQLEEFDTKGFLVFPELFSRDEVTELRREANRVSLVDSPAVFREGKQSQAKTMFRLHEEDGATASRAYRLAARSPRTLGVARQLLDDDELYIHHCKVNMKAAIEGTAWPWHQDFGSWHLDGIAKPDMVTMMVMLDDVNELNGCLYMLPGSHKAQRQDPYWDDTTAYKFWAVGPDKMRQLMKMYDEPVAMTGTAGLAAIFHCNLLHSSGHNLSIHDRWQAYFCFNRVVNHPLEVEDPRPDYVRSTNWTPLQISAPQAIV